MKALQIPLEDPSTGAEASLHVVRSYSYDLDMQFCQARLAGYVSKKAFEDGKQPIAQRHVTVPGVPHEGVAIIPWLLDQLKYPADDEMRAHPAYQPSPFIGADLVDVEVH